MKNWMKRIGMMVLGVVMTFGVSIPAFASDAHFTFTNGEEQYEQPSVPTPGGGGDTDVPTPGGGSGTGGTSSGGGIRNGLTSLTGAVRTGDHSVLLFVLLAIAAALVIGILVCSKKNLRIKRGKTLLSMLLVAALAVGGITTSSFAFASDDAETQGVIGVVEEDAVGGTDASEAGTQDVVGVVEEDTADGTDGSEDDPQEMVQNLAADPQDMDGEDVESGIQPLLSSTNNISAYTNRVEVFLDLEGLDEVGETFAQIASPTTSTIVGDSGDTPYTVEVTVGVYDENGNCVTPDPGDAPDDSLSDTTKGTSDKDGYPYYYITSAGSFGGLQMYYTRYYNGGEMTVDLAGNDYFYIASVGENETVKVSESAESTLLNVTDDVVEQIGASTILSVGKENATSGSAAAGGEIRLVNTISEVKGSEIYVLMTEPSTEVDTDKQITFVVERYDAASGTWSPASGISYLLFDGCTGVTRNEDGVLVSHDTEDATQITDSEQTTGTDGTITVTKTENGYPFIRFTADEVYANVWEGMGDGTIRIVASSDGTDAAWGWLVGYDGEEQDGGPLISLSSSDTFYYGNDDELTFAVEKEMLDGEECDEAFTFYLRNLTSASSLPIVTESQILSYEIGAGISYVVYDVETGEAVGSGVTDVNGAFTLKPGQYATFSVPEDTTWQIFEDENADYPLYSVEANDDADNPGVWGYAGNASIVDGTSGVVQDAAALAAGKATLILTLTDAEDGTPIAGAVFSLYMDGKEILSGLTTDANGQITVTECTAGTYYFVETKVADGYLMPDSTATTTVTVLATLTQNTEYPISMTNEKYWGFKYAVRIYGICADDYSTNGGVSTSGKASLTFGPATASGYTTYHQTYKAHLTEEEYEAGSGYCIHWMTWEEIISLCNQYQGDESALRSVFGDCLTNGCTKAVELDLNDTIGKGVTYNWSGDGNPQLTNDTIQDTYLNWNDYGVGLSGGYPASKVRATLVGVDSYTDSAYASSGLTSDTCLFSCFPAELQEAVVPKVVKSGTGYTTYDTLWLFSQNELWGYTAADEGSQYEYLQEAGVTTGNVSHLTNYKESYNDDYYGDARNGWWTSSLNGSILVWYVNDTGGHTTISANVADLAIIPGLAPGFCLK